ncbi:MAG: hypothetical protein KKB70_11235 [Proteobacteria bacterium]|nr:hypothetical protein [Pseudomonadota bacterium]MBU1610722.1 hypothetical protein [Pseudomonadota bacterium]
MSCEYQAECPFHRANHTSRDAFVKQVIADYCENGHPGCVHREAKKEYNTFLAINQTPCDTILTT